MNVAVPLQINPVSQTCPMSSHFSVVVSVKFSFVVPFGRIKTFNGISKMFSVPFCMYDILIVPWKFPGTFGSNSNVMFCIPLPDIS